VLRAKALPSMLEHADRIERLLEQHGPDEATAALSLTAVWPVGNGRERCQRGSVSLVREDVCPGFDAVRDKPH
jgi:hypothetical protein